MKRSNKLMRFLTMLTTCCILTSLSAVPVFAYEGSANTAEEKDATIIRDTDADGEDGDPFAVEGNGTLTDESDSSQNKLFYIVSTANGNNFYIVIDKDSNTNNVYMLSAIDEADLADFIEEGEEETGSPITDDSTDPDLFTDVAEPEDNPEENPDSGEAETEPGEEPEAPEDETGSAGKYVAILLLVLACAGVVAGYYLLRIRNRDDQDDEDENAYGNDEQPDVADDAEADDAEENEEPEDTDEADTSEDAPEDGNPGGVPFVDYPDVEDEAYPEEQPDERM